MNRADAARLAGLAAIWGASFLFLRIVSPVMGPLLTADGRMLLAGLALAAYFRLVGFDPQWRRWWPQYLVAGLLTSGLPFLLFAYAALQLPAGIMAVLNATSPMWGAVLGAVFLGERLSARRAAGLALGIAGVALVSQAPADGGLALAAIAACLAAAFCYGLTGVYLKRFARDVPARGLAVGTQLLPAALMFPLIFLGPAPGAPTVLVAGSMLALGLLCGALAYILYFRLIADLGPAGALTVTYLIPLFGMLWGALFLGEAVSRSMLAGAALVVAGTILVLRN